MIPNVTRARWREKPTRCNWSGVYYRSFTSTCFGHHYAHRQENETVYYRIWCSALFCWLWSCGAALCESYCSTVHVPSPHNRSQHNQCRTPHAVVQGLVLLTMGIMMPETCWNISLIINIWLVASCWFLSLHPMFMMHGHKSLKLKQSYSLVTSPLFFHNVRVLVQALHTEHGEIFQALMLKRYVLLSKALLVISFDDAIGWNSPISKTSFSLSNT